MTTTAEMRAWRVTAPASIDRTPIHLVQQPRPEPGPGEIAVEVLACGVCRTDLHVTEGDLPVHRAHMVPGHEIVGRVVAVGPATASAHRIGDLVGVPWLASTCGECRYCRADRENLCPHSQYTGWDLDGGYADFVITRAAYALALPNGYDPVTLAPLLCAGIIG